MVSKPDFVTDPRQNLHGKLPENADAPVLTTLKDEPEWSIKRLLDILAGRAIAPLKGNGWGGGTVMHLRIYPV